MVQAASGRVPRAPPYSGSRSVSFRFRLKGLHLLRLSFQSHSAAFHCPFLRSFNPGSCRFGLLPFRSPLLRESLLFSFPPGTEMFQFPGFYSHHLYIQWRMTEAFPSAGFPHSDTRDSLTVYVSSRRFAVFCVLLLLYMPRHPPYALPCLIIFPRFYAYFLLQELLTASSVNLSTSTERLLSVFPVCYPVFKELPLSDLFDPSKPVRNIFTLLKRDFFLLRKEVIHPHVLVGIPCYDLTPITSPAFDGSLLCRLGHRLRALPALMV